MFVFKTRSSRVRRKHFKSYVQCLCHLLHKVMATQHVTECRSFGGGAISTFIGDHTHSSYSQAGQHWMTPVAPPLPPRREEGWVYSEERMRGNNWRVARRGREGNFRPKSELMTTERQREQGLRTKGHPDCGRRMPLVTFASFLIKSTRNDVMSMVAGGWSASSFVGGLSNPAHQRLTPL